jgi:class 3 adenylate cyclase
MCESELSAYTIQTGDGCFIVFDDVSEDIVMRFCLELHQRIESTNSTGNDAGDILLRYALHMGPVYKVMDLNQQANFIGDGINYCARLLAVKEPSVLYASKQFYDAIKAQNSSTTLYFECGQIYIKHKTELDDVYLLKLDDPSAQIKERE